MSSSKRAKPAPKKQQYKTFANDCAVLMGGFDGPIIASGPALGPNKIVARLLSYKPVDDTPWMGFTLRIPLGAGQTENEKSGFGVRHICKLAPPSIFLFFPPTT